jgi:hypothetical protein
MTPTQFRSLASIEQAELHAAYDIEQEIEAYYASEQRKRIKD